MSEVRIHFVASPTETAREAAKTMQKKYGECPLEAATVIVALGGDGFMLRTLHRFIEADLPVYGMKLGDVGFLMNRYAENDLHKRLAAANLVELI